MKISGYTFVHDALRGGYPVAEAIAAVRPAVDEVVAVDMASTDGTRDLLLRCADRVIDSPWTNEAGVKPMNLAFTRHVECEGDVVLLFEADEVWDPGLAMQAAALARAGHTDLQVWRVQVSCNGQRMPWAPHLVHRVFPRGGGTYLDSPVVCPVDHPRIVPRWGYVWDLTMWFRENYWDRRKAHGECWGAQRNVVAREHFLQSPEVSDEDLEAVLADDLLWQATSSPFALPDVVRPLLGMERYRPTI